jgi:hypothetical protein
MNVANPALAVGLNPRGALQADNALPLALIALNENLAGTLARRAVAPAAALPGSTLLTGLPPQAPAVTLATVPWPTDPCPRPFIRQRGLFVVHTGG